MSTVPEYDSSLSEKHYPEHIVNIVDQISQLTLVETAELNELLKVLVGGTYGVGGGFHKTGDSCV